MDMTLNKRCSIDDALRYFLKHVHPLMRTEDIPLEFCTDRVVAEKVSSKRDVLHYRRAAMDGYAVYASDTAGASPDSPVYLYLSDMVSVGRVVWVHTGDIMPTEADAVVVVEDTERVGDIIEVCSHVHPGKNVAEVGEDIKEGDLIFEKGHLLRPCDAAVLASMGLNVVNVFQRPVIAIIPTGDELVSREKAGEVPPPGMVLETNGLMTALYIRKWGGIPRYNQIVPDEPDCIKKAIEANLDADMIILSGGTSVGKRDHVPDVVTSLGELLVHGIKVSPGKPTALGIIDQRPVVCLPGYPVAGFVALYFLVRPLIRRLASINCSSIPIVKRPLATRITSKKGNANFICVAFDGKKVHPFTGAKAGSLSVVAKADGFFLVPENVEEYDEGEEVDVFLLE